MGAKKLLAKWEGLYMHSKQNNSQTQWCCRTHARARTLCTLCLSHKYLYLLCNYNHQYVMVYGSLAVRNLNTLLCHWCFPWVACVCVWASSNQLDHSEHLTWTYTKHKKGKHSWQHIQEESGVLLFFCFFPLLFLCPLHVVTSWASSIRWGQPDAIDTIGVQ